MSDADLSFGGEANTKSQKKRVQRARQKREKILRTVMGSPEGRSFVWQLLSDAGVTRVTFAQCPYQTAFNEGQRNLGNKVFSEVLTMCPDLYQIAVKEANSFKEKDTDE